MSEILVTGGTGFIGEGLINYLNKKSNKIVCFSRNGNDDKNNIIYEKVDITNFKKVKEISNKYKFKTIIHLVHTQGPTETENNIGQSFNINFNSLKNILNICSENKCKFIYTSSAAVYGEEQTIPIKEKSNLKPVNIYGIYKAMEEEFIKEFCENNNIEYTILRIFNIYSEKGKFGIINYIKNSIKLNKELNLFGENQLRDFIHSEDLYRVFESCLNNKKTKNQIINVASGKGISIKNIIGMFLKYKRLSINYINNNQKEFDSVADLGKFIEIFEFKPKNITKLIEEDIKNGQ